MTRGKMEKVLFSVSDRSLRHTLDYDRNTRLPLYARFGVPKTWLVDRGSDTVEVHSRPVGGTYRDITLVGRGDPLFTKSTPTPSSVGQRDR